MEYTRSTGEHCYETFEGTPVIGAAFDKIVGYECSCGDENCELYKAERG